MFFVKTNLNKDTVLMTNLTEENVFTTCPECGEEVQVDLTDLAGEPDFDLYATGVCCPECSKRHWLAEHRRGARGRKEDFDDA